jgi:hypothetical protein
MARVVKVKKEFDGQVALGCFTEVGSSSARESLVNFAC